jgi:retron-type reverse transcriptase
VQFKTRSIITGAKHILSVDIKNFFPSITIEQVSDTFQSLGYNKSVSDMLSEICCLDDCVPQGAPTSPAIANLVLREMDEKLSKFAQDYSHKYSRYADDLTFSSQDRIDNGFFSKIKSAVKNAGFELKNEKNAIFRDGRTNGDYWSSS